MKNLKPKHRLFYLGIKAVFVKNKKVLLLRNTRFKSKGYVYWDFPGGRMHEGETVKETLTREVFEETGIADFRIGKLAGTYLLKRDVLGGEKRGLVILIFSCETSQENVVISEEHDRYQWFSKAEIKNMKLNPRDPDDGYYKDIALPLL